MSFGGAFSAFSQIPLDWLIVGIFFVVVSADALRSGSVRAASIALSFPIAALLLQELPHTYLLSSLAGQFTSPIEQAILLVILVVLLFICFHQMLRSFDPYTSLISAAASGLAATVVVLVVWTQSPALQAIWHFDSQIGTVFGEPLRFFWLLGAYLLLAFVGS